MIGLLSHKIIRPVSSKHSLFSCLKTASSFFKNIVNWCNWPNMILMINFWNFIFLMTVNGVHLSLILLKVLRNWQRSHSICTLVETELFLLETYFASVHIEKLLDWGSQINILCLILWDCRHGCAFRCSSKFRWINLHQIHWGKPLGIGLLI